MKNWIEAQQDADRPPDYLWAECDNCDGQGEFHNPVRDGDYGYACQKCNGDGGWYRSEDDE